MELETIVADTTPVQVAERKPSAARRVYFRLGLLLSLIAIATSSAALTSDGSPQARVARALANIAAAPEVFFAGPHDRFQVRDVIVDAGGREHVRFDRLHKGLRVVGGDVVVHEHESGQLDGASLELRRILDVGTQPNLTPSDAIAAAAAQFVGERAGSANAELTVYARDDAAQLAFEVVLRGVRPDSTPSELHVFIDALSAEILDQWDGIETNSAAAGAAAQCSGDCDGNGSVDVNELVLGVNMALGNQPLSACPSFDCHHDSVVAIDCLVQAVKSALDGCAAGMNGHGFFYGPVTLPTDFTGTAYDLSDPDRADQSTTDMNNATDRNGTQSSGTLFTDADNVWGSGDLSSRQSVAVDAQYGMA